MEYKYLQIAYIRNHC